MKDKAYKIKEASVLLRDGDVREYPEDVCRMFWPFLIQSSPFPSSIKAEIAKSKTRMKDPGSTFAIL